MTKEEIKALIDAKIAGQGSAVDAGSALPAILNGILELAATPPAKKVIEIMNTFSQVSIEEALTNIKINGAQVLSLSELEPYLEIGTIINHAGTEMEIVVKYGSIDNGIVVMGGINSGSFGSYCILGLDWDNCEFDYGEV